MSKKLLVVMDEGIGNMIALTAALRALKEYDSSIQITVFGKHLSTPIIEDSLFVDKVINTPDSDSYDIGFFALWFEGYAAPFIERLAHQCDKVYTIDLRYNIPEYLQYMEIPKFFGCSIDSLIPKPFIGLPFDFDQSTVALCDTCAPATEWKRKRWPYYPELAQKLIDDGLQILVIGDESDRDTFSKKQWPDEIIDCIGKFSLSELKFVFQHCQLAIGNDGGIPKLACAIGIPTIFIFGATYVPKNQPIGKNFRIVYLPLDCSPCQYSKRWSDCSDFKCMELLSADAVYQAAKEVIDETNSCDTT